MVRVLESASPDEGLLTMFAVRVQVKCYHNKSCTTLMDTSDKSTSYVQELRVDIIQEKVIRIPINHISHALNIATEMSERQVLFEIVYISAFATFSVNVSTSEL